MLPKELSYFTFSYYTSFLYGVLPFSFDKRHYFTLSKGGMELWTCQICLTIAMNVKNYLDSLKNPCNNALSCAVYIQEVLNGVTVELQVLLLLFNRNFIRDCLYCLVDISKMSTEVCVSTVSGNRKSTFLPVLYNIIFTSFTIGRCIFMFVIKPKSPIIEMVS